MHEAALVCVREPGRDLGRDAAPSRRRAAAARRSAALRACRPAGTRAPCTASRRPRRSRRAPEMFGCESAATARASRSKRARSAVGARILIATRRSSSSSWASQTELIEPRPSCSSRRYRPAITSSVTARLSWSRDERPAEHRRGAARRCWRASRRCPRSRSRSAMPHGRVLAVAATARTDLPPFDSSAMDGYAVRAQDTPGRLRVVDQSAAGRPASVGGGRRRGDRHLHRRRCARRARTPSSRSSEWSWTARRSRRRVSRTATPSGRAAVTCGAVTWCCLPARDSAPAQLGALAAVGIRRRRVRPAAARDDPRHRHRARPAGR